MLGQIPIRGSSRSVQTNLDRDEELAKAALRGDVEDVKLWRSKGASFLYQYAENPRWVTLTPLAHACQKGHLQIVKFIMEQDLSTATFVDSTGRNLLHLAAGEGHLNIVQHLMSQMSIKDLNIPCIRGWTVITHALFGSNLDLVLYLHSKGASMDPNLHTYSQKYNDYANPIHIAANCRNSNILKWILDLQIFDINAQNKYGKTALHFAADGGRIDHAELLLKSGADLSIKDAAGFTAMDIANREYFNDLSTLLWKHGSPVSTSFGNPEAHLGEVTWRRIRHMGLPSPRSNCSILAVGQKLVLSGGRGPKVSERSAEASYRSSVESVLLDDLYIADLSNSKVTSLIPQIDIKTTSLQQIKDMMKTASIQTMGRAKLARPELKLDPLRCGQYLTIDPDGLGAGRVNPDWILPEIYHKTALVLANQPFIRIDRFAYFEVTMVSSGNMHMLTVGMVSEGYKLDDHPGWYFDSYGHHGDDGNLYHNVGSGAKFGERFNVGDTIGCGINFVENGGEVFWSKNGTFLGVTHHFPQSDKYYAAIGFGDFNTSCRVNFGAQPFVFNFKVPTITWTKLPSPVATKPPTDPAIVPIGDCYILAIPRVSRSKSNSVFLLELTNNSWQQYDTNGIWPRLDNTALFHRIENDLYVWMRGIGKSVEPTFYRLNLESWTWTNVFKDEILGHPIFDEEEKSLKGMEKTLNGHSRLKTLVSTAFSYSSALASTGTSSLDSPHIALRPPPPISSFNVMSLLEYAEGRSITTGGGSHTILEQKLGSLSNAASSGISGPRFPETLPFQTNSSNSKLKGIEFSDSSFYQEKCVASNLNSFRHHLQTTFRTSSFCTLGEELIFLSSNEWLRVDPRTWEHSSYTISGPRPACERFTCLAFGTEIITFGGNSINSHDSDDAGPPTGDTYVLDLLSSSWYKPRITGLCLPRARSYHSVCILNIHKAKFLLYHQEESETSVIAPHRRTKRQAPIFSLQHSGSNSDQSYYRLMVVAGGFTKYALNNIEFVAVDTRKRVEKLGKLLVGFTIINYSKETASSMNYNQFLESIPVQLAPSDVVQPNFLLNLSRGLSTIPGLQYDIFFKVKDPKGSLATIGAHRIVLWGRCSSFKRFFDFHSSPPQFRYQGAIVHPNGHISVPIEAPTELIKAWIQFLYTDTLNFSSGMVEDNLQGFYRFIMYFSPEYGDRVISEYIHSKIYVSSILSSCLLNLFKSATFVDVALTFSSWTTPLYAHKLILCARNPFFERLIVRTLQSYGAQPVPSILTINLDGSLLSSSGSNNLEDFSQQSIAILVEFIYSKQLEYKDVSGMLISLLHLAAKMEEEDLFKLVDLYTSYQVSTQNAAKLLLLGDKLNASSLKETCIQLIIANLNNIHYTDFNESNLVQAILLKEGM